MIEAPVSLTPIQRAAVDCNTSPRSMRKAIAELGIVTILIPYTACARGITPSDLERLSAYFKAKQGRD